MENQFCSSTSVNTVCKNLSFSQFVGFASSEVEKCECVDRNGSSRSVENIKSMTVIEIDEEKRIACSQVQKKLDSLYQTFQSEILVAKNQLKAWNLQKRYFMIAYDTARLAGQDLKKRYIDDDSCAEVIGISDYQAWLRSISTLYTNDILSFEY